MSAANTTFSKCLGLKEAEIEDLFDESIYHEYFRNTYIVDVRHAPFTEKGKWSQRIRMGLTRSGKNWTDSDEYKDKAAIAAIAAKSPQSAIHPARKDILKSLLESVFEDSRLIPKLKKAAGKNYRFCPSVSHWRDDETKEGDAKYPWIGLHWEIWFKKARGNTRALGVGFFVDDDAKWHVEVYRYLPKTDEIDGKTIFDRRSDVTLEHFK